MVRPRTHVNFWLGTFCTTAACLILWGCERKEPSPAPATAPATDAGPTSGLDGLSPGQIGVDGDDDPNYPRALPKTNEIRGWIKTQAVRVRPAAKLGQAAEDPVRRALAGKYKVDWVAQCRYDQHTTSAEVLYVQMHTPEDAFGLLSVLTTQPGEFRQADRSMRVTETIDPTMRSLVQQGKVFLEITFRGGLDFEPVRQTCRKLAESIAFTLPSADPPLLLQLVPDNQRATTKVWFVRDLSVLPKADNPVIRQLDAKAMNDRLGLTGEATLSIAALPPAEGKPGDLIWLAQYPDTAGAAAAHDRYLAAIKDKPTDLDKTTTLSAPRGTFLAGVWTANQETTPGLLKQLQEALPR